MSEVAKRLRDRRLNVWEQAKGLADTAAEENRAFSAEEQGTWDALNEELDKLDARIKSVLDTEKRARDADDAFNAVTGRKPDARAGSHAGSDGRDVNAEVRSFLKGEAGAPRSMEFIHNTQANGPINYRTLQSNTGTPTSIVPTDFYDQLIAHLIEVSGVMQTGPTVLNTAGGETLQVPKTTPYVYVTPT